MKCKSVHNELIFYLDQELPDHRMVKIAKHLEECSDCSGFLEELKKDLLIIDAERNPEVSPYFYTRLSSRLDEKSDIQEQSGWARLLQPAFFSLLLISAVYGGVRLGSNAYTPVPSQPKANVLSFVNDFADEPIESFLLDKL